MAEHVNYTKADFTPEEIARENIIAKYVFQGLAICKKCGAAESEQDEYPTCEAFRAHLTKTDPKPVQHPTTGLGPSYVKAKARGPLEKGEPVVIVSHGDQGPTVESARRKVIEDVYRRGGPGAGASKYRK